MVAKRDNILDTIEDYPAADWDAYCERIAHLHLPRFDEIPDFSLYMDQLISFVGKQMELFATPTEKPLTASMVNNYVKMRLVPQPKAKRYEPLHVAYLIVVCILKRMYSMSDIEHVIELDVQHRFQIPPAYDKFIDIFEESLRAMFSGKAEATAVGGLQTVPQTGAFGITSANPDELNSIDRDYVLLATSVASKIFIEQALLSARIKRERLKKAEHEEQAAKKAAEQEKAAEEEKAAKAARAKSAKKD